MAFGAAVLVYQRAKRIAEDEDRGVGDVLTEMPARLFSDLRTIPDDLREAAGEGKQAAADRAQDIDEAMRAARSGTGSDEPDEGQAEARP
jgi:hypothetical protein